MAKVAGDAAADLERRTQRGAESWLPASLYLDPLEEASQPYMSEGLCNALSPLFNPAHCDLCHDRSAETYLYLSWFVIIMEHLLILLKLTVVASVPEKAAWVRKSEARSHFVQELMQREALALTGPS